MPLTLLADLNVTKSCSDTKLYRQVILPNGLRCVLVEDTKALESKGKYGYDDEDDDESDGDDMEESETEAADDMSDGEGQGEGQGDSSSDSSGTRKAACAMVVGVGSYFDPEEMQGLSHFLEHMLFMGTAKYPVENSYDEYISKHGGGDNAYTEMEHTVYYFDISQSHLFPCLDMFAQFFISPLFKKEGVDRELKSIESEFQLNKNSDSTRIEQLYCHTAKPLSEHPFSSFSWGNTESLKTKPESIGVNIHDTLRKFYDQHYYAENMRLVVTGGFTLDELEAEVMKSFPSIPRSPRVPLGDMATIHDPLGGRSKSPLERFGFPFPQSSLQTIYRIVPVRDRHTLQLLFTLPPQTSNYLSKPTDFISHLLGHEGKGSLLSWLKAKGYGSGIVCGSGGSGITQSSMATLFQVTLNLSTQGVPHWKEITTKVFGYIGMLRSHFKKHGSYPAHIFDEIKAVADMSFKFQDEDDPQALVEELAEVLSPCLCMKPEHLLTGPLLVFEFDANKVNELLDSYLTPTNLRIDFLSATFGRASDFDEGIDVDDEKKDGDKGKCYSSSRSLLLLNKINMVNQVIFFCLSLQPPPRRHGTSPRRPQPLPAILTPSTSPPPPPKSSPSSKLASSATPCPPLS